MYGMISLAVMGALLAAPQKPEKGSPEADRALLEGTWVVESATWGIESISDLVKARKNGTPIMWAFEENNFKAFVGGPKDATEEGTILLDPSKSPKHLDLIPPKGSERGPRKCLYSIDGDELKIAMSLWFAPGKPEDETEEGRKMLATRPKNLPPKREDLTLILVLKKQKK